MFVTREQLKASSSEVEALAIYNKVKETGEWLSFLNTFLHDEDYQVTRNALWALTKATNEELSSLQPMLHELIDKALNEKNSSVRRLSMNIIVRLEMKEDDLRTDFLDFCLDHMQNPDEYPGIQSLCLKLAYKMCMFYPELMDELKRTLVSMDMAFYSPALRSVRNRILANKYHEARR
ncbi:MAG: hypothetical protein KBT20_03035 [Bacteroidales bacterium]|nr:hypothetical protein [Candidatus Liminaster caballi]